MQLGLCQAILDGKLNLTEAVKREWKDRRGGKRGQPQRGPWLLFQSAAPDEVILVVVQRFFDAGSRARPNIPPPPGPPAQNQPLDFFSLLLSSFPPLSSSNHTCSFKMAFGKLYGAPVCDPY